MTQDNAVKATAILLIELKTSRGQCVPEYAKRLRDGLSTVGDKRVGQELFASMAQMTPVNRSRLFQDKPHLKTWFDQYIEDNRTTSIGVAVYLDA